MVVVTAILLFPILTQGSELQTFARGNVRGASSNTEWADVLTLPLAHEGAL